MGRAIARACTYRMLATAEVFAVAYLWTGHIGEAGPIAIVTAITSTAIYIGHDYIFPTHKKA